MPLSSTPDKSFMPLKSESPRMQHRHLRMHSCLKVKDLQAVLLTTFSTSKTRELMKKMPISCPVVSASHQHSPQRRNRSNAFQKPSAFASSRIISAALHRREKAGATYLPKQTRNVGAGQRPSGHVSSPPRFIREAGQVTI